MADSDRTIMRTRWLAAFMSRLQPSDVSTPLKGAALSGDLAAWTRLLTEAVVRSCETLGWPAAAKGHRLAMLPQAGQEYLGIDVMAFPPGADGAEPRWALPLAVFELENLRERAAYSMWKVIVVRASLRVVFAYRNDWEQVRQLVPELRDGLIRGLTVEERLGLGGDLLLVTGSRGEGETFPYGYFKVWRLNPNTGDFERLTDWG